MDKYTVTCVDGTVNTYHKEYVVEMLYMLEELTRTETMWSLSDHHVCHTMDEYIKGLTEGLRLSIKFGSGSCICVSRKQEGPSDLYHDGDVAWIS